MIKVNRAIPKGKIKLLLFDLDGTLVDSRKDLANSVNAMRANYHMPALSESQISSYVGDGAPALVRRSLGFADDRMLSVAEEEFFKTAMDFFADYYMEHKLDYTREYQGVTEALTAISAESGKAMSVLTNKHIAPARDIVSALLLDEFFTSVYGGNSFHTKKPDPHGVSVLLREHGVLPEETVMIGDSSVDMQTARNGGLWSCGCTFGLTPQTLEQHPGDVLVDEPREWVQVFV